MNRIALRQGQAFLIQGRKYRFAERARDVTRMPIFKEVGTDLPRPLRDDEFIKLHALGQVREITQEEATSADPVPPPILFDIKDVKTEWSREATKRSLLYAQTWESLGRPPRTDAGLGPVIERAAAELGEGVRPCTRTVKRIIAKWLASGGCASGLVPKVGLRGRSSSIDPAVEQIVSESIWDEYMTLNSPCLSSVYGTVLSRIDQKNSEQDPGLPKLKHPPIQYLYRFVRGIDRYTLALHRKGKNEADRRFGPRGPGVITTRHGQRWEMDTTVTDLILVAPGTREPIGRAYITVIIDHYTRMIMGFYLGFEPESLLSAVETLRHAMWYKDYIKTDYPDIKHEMPGFGRCEVLVVDNASQYRERFKQVCNSLSIDLQFTPVLKPWFKGTIERLFRTLTLQVFQRVPGTTFSSIWERNKEVAPEVVAVATLDDARHLLHQWVNDQYHYRAHRGLGFNRRPIDAWNESVALHETVPPPDAETLNAVLGIPFKATPQHYGIQYQNMLWNSAFVANIRIAPTQVKKVDCVLNPADIRQVMVKNPETGEWGVAQLYKPFAEISGDPITLRQVLAAKELQKRQPEKYGHDGGFVEAMAFTHKYVRENLTKGSIKQRKAAARHVFDGSIGTPLQPASVDAEASGIPISNALFDGIPSGVPTLGVSPSADPATLPPGLPELADDVPPEAVPQSETDDDDLDALVASLGLEAHKK